MKVSSTVRNEQIKLFSSFFNSLSVSLIVIGSVVPVAKYFTKLEITVDSTMTIYWIVLGLATHVVAQTFLGELQTE